MLNKINPRVLTMISSLILLQYTEDIAGVIGPLMILGDPA